MVSNIPLTLCIDNFRYKILPVRGDFTVILAYFTHKYPPFPNNLRRNGIISRKLHPAYGKPGPAQRIPQRSALADREDPVVASVRLKYRW